MLQVQWEFHDGQGYEEYPGNINVIIEKAYQGKEPYAEWPEKEEDGTRVRCVQIDKELFECMNTVLE